MISIREHNAILLEFKVQNRQLTHENKRYREVIQESNVIFAEAIESIDLEEKVKGLDRGVKITYEALEGEE